MLIESNIFSKMSMCKIPKCVTEWSIYISPLIKYLKLFSNATRSLTFHMKKELLSQWKLFRLVIHLRSSFKRGLSVK